MKKYISHFSAAYKWDIPFVEHAIGAEHVRNNQDNKIIHVTVPDRRGVYRKKGYHIHLCKTPLPKNAVIQREGELIASPELVFLQLANSLSIHRLILLGILLCSCPPGKTSEAISSKKKLNTFLRNTVGHHGHVKAEYALKHIEDGAASLVESIMFMILTLPHTLGGYGLNGASFNCKFSLDADMSRKMRQKNCFVDFYYAKQKLAIEYDSFEHHNNPASQGKDFMRTTALERQGVKVLRLSTIQLYDKESCEEFVFKLARNLGKRIRIRSTKFRNENEQIRALLPSKNNR